VPASIHGCAIDKDNNVYVAGNFDGVIQKYSPDGKLLLQIGVRGKFDSVDGTRNIPIPNKSGKLPDKRGTAWWVAFSPDREQKLMYMMDGGTEQVHVLDHASGKILSSFGRPGHQAGNFTHGHTLAVDSKGSVYVAETDWGRRIQKFKIEP
jgi:sugar lactone lactonase YvrE